MVSPRGWISSVRWVKVIKTSQLYPSSIADVVKQIEIVRCQCSFVSGLGCLFGYSLQKFIEGFIINICCDYFLNFIKSTNNKKHQVERFGSKPMTTHVHTLLHGH